MTYQERIEQLEQEFDVVADQADGTLHTMTIQQKKDESVFVFTISELYTIARDGVEYDEAFDPVGSTRKYTETANAKGGGDEITDSEFVEMLEAVL